MLGLLTFPPRICGFLHSVQTNAEMYLKMGQNCSYKSISCTINGRRPVLGYPHTGPHRTERSTRSLCFKP